MNLFKTVALLGLLSALLVGVCYWVIGGATGILIGVLFAQAMSLFSWFYSDKIALNAYQAEPLSAEAAPELHDMLQRLCDRAHLPLPRLYIVPSQAPNAFATGRDPQHSAVAVTEGILRLLQPAELEGVIAHELSHIKHRDTLTQAVAAMVAGAISSLAQLAQFYLLFRGSRNSQRNGNPLVTLLTIMIAPVAATVIQMAISRTREYAADKRAAELTGNPRGLACALQRLDSTARKVPLQANPAFEPLLIMNGFSGQTLSILFSTHPSTEARIQALLKLEEKMASLP